jgi:tetratricopeptide (TPR) repeat protein
MLEPLTREHSRELIEELLAVPDLPEEIKDLILNRSEGNSFFLEEIIRMFIDEGVLWRDDGRWRARPGIRDLRVPDTVQGLIAARIDRLPPDEKQVVQAASVIGRAFWRGAVTHLVEGPLKKNVAANLQGVLSKDLVIEWETSHFAGEREYAFKHGLIREVAYEALPKARRGLKHRQVAEWMEKAAGDRSDEYVELLAYHYEQAAKLEDAAEPLSKGEVEVLKRKAGYYLGRAGAKAADREAFRTAGDLYQRAMAFIAEPGPRTKAVEAKTYIELLCGYAEVLDRLGEFERAAQQLHKAIELADAREEKRMAAMARRQLGEVCRDRSDMAGARRWLEEASILAHEVGDKHIEADSLRLLGTVAFMTNNYPEAEESLHRALALFQELGGRSHDGGVMQNLSAMYLKQGQYDEAERWAKAAIERAHEVRNKRAEAWALDLLSDLQSGRGDIKEAMASAQHGLDLFREISDKRGEASTLQSLGNLYREGGRWVEAEQVLHEAMSLSEEMGNPLHIGSLWLSLGWLNLYRGDFAEAERFVKDNLLGHAERLGELRTITIATGQVLLSWVYAYQGRHAEAAEAGDAAVKDLERSGSRDALRSAYLGAALGYLGQGQPDRAMERVQSQMRIIAELDVGQQGTARRVLAMVQAARGEDGAADESFRHSIDLLLGKGFEANLMLCYLEYGKFLRQRGRMPESRDVLNRARRICQEIGASFWLAEIERLSG